MLMMFASLLLLKMQTQRALSIFVVEFHVNKKIKNSSCNKNQMTVQPFFKQSPNGCSKHPPQTDFDSEVL